MQTEFDKISEILMKSRVAQKAYHRQGKVMFGMYYDNPQKVKDPTKMRAVVGFLFKSKDQSEKDLIIEHLGRLGMKYANFDKTKCLFTTFEVKFPAIVSYMVAPAQFYHEVELYIKRRRQLREMIAEAKTDNL